MLLRSYPDICPGFLQWCCDEKHIVKSYIQKSGFFVREHRTRKIFPRACSILHPSISYSSHFQNLRTFLAQIWHCLCQFFHFYESCACDHKWYRVEDNGQAGIYDKFVARAKELALERKVGDNYHYVHHPWPDHPWAYHPWPDHATKTLNINCIINFLYWQPLINLNPNLWPVSYTHLTLPTIYSV